MSTIDTIPRVEPRVSPPQPRRSRFGSYLGGAVLVVLGGLWALDLAGTIDVRLAVVLPSLLIIFGLALIIGATEGPHSGLVVAGLFLSIAVGDRGSRACDLVRGRRRRTPLPRDTTDQPLVQLRGGLRRPSSGPARPRDGRVGRSRSLRRCRADNGVVARVGTG